MGPMSLLYILLIMGIVWTIIWLRVIASVPDVQEEAIVDQNTATLRRQLMWPMIVAILIGMALSFYFAPYPIVRSRTFGEPQMTVNVTAMQFLWKLETEDPATKESVKLTEIPANTVVRFNVTSLDVNHGFAIYNADGQLVTQVQAMPGYTNELIFSFDTPGEYTIRCLEYCGIFHHDMILEEFMVV